MSENNRKIATVCDGNTGEAMAVILDDGYNELHFGEGRRELCKELKIWNYKSFKDFEKSLKNTQYRLEKGTPSWVLEETLISERLRTC